MKSIWFWIFVWVPLISLAAYLILDALILLTGQNNNQ